MARRPKVIRLLNYCGITPELLEYTVDRNPHKQGRFLPGTHIPIYEPERIYATKPDYILILPWNLKDEIINQLSFAQLMGRSNLSHGADPSSRRLFWSIQIRRI